MTRHIFLSYSRDDVNTARKIQKKLRRAGFNVWMDEQKIEIGTDWRAAIEEAIKSSLAIVVALSPSAVASKPVLEEIRTSFEYGVKPFPLIVHGKPDNAVPDSLKTQHYEVATEKNFNSGVTKLIWNLCDYAGIQRPTPQWRILAGALILILMTAVVGLSWIQLTRKTIPSVSIVSARYEASRYDSHLIDFRTAAEDGIPFGTGQPLTITDVWIWGSENAPGYTVEASIYANNERIGASESKAIQAGIFELGDITPELYRFEGFDTEWKIQSTWEDLDFRLSVSDGNTVVREERFHIKRNGNGLSRLQEMPLASFATILYSVNDGPQQLLDLRDAVQNGLAVRAGDQLTLSEVWYKTDSTTSAKIFGVSAYLTIGGYNEETNQNSPSNVFFRGVHSVANFQPFSWTVKAEYRFWIISLVRNDNALLDRLLIPIKSGT